jgi:hypothetical protein
MAMDWIRQRAAVTRQESRGERWRLQKERVIESHSHEFFEELTDLMERSVAAFNKEFEGDERAGVTMEKRLNRFILRHAAPPAVSVDCRLDYAAHSMRYRIDRESLHGKQTFTQENELKFDLAAANKIQLLTAEQIPLSLEQTTQQLLEPFF